MKSRDNNPKGWIGLCMALLPSQYSTGYMGDGFYRSKDPTNNVKVLTEKSYNGKPMHTRTK